MPNSSARSRRDPDATRQRWVDRFARFRSSGQTVARFCAAEGISEPSFYSWKRRLADLHDPVPDPLIVPLRLTDPASAGPIELALPSGLLLRLPADTPVRRIAELLEALEARPC